MPLLRELLSYILDTVVQNWDTANKESELSDYSVCTTWGIKRETIYLLHVLRKRLDYPDLKRAVETQAKLWHARVILIEDKASGTQLIQQLRNIVSGTKGVKSEGDKIMRMQAQTPALENGMVRLPKEAPWLGDYVHELTSFPKAKYDDQVDSTSQALKWIATEGIEPGIITYYIREIARQRDITEDEVREQTRAKR